MTIQVVTVNVGPAEFNLSAGYSFPSMEAVTAWLAENYPRWTSLVLTVLP